MFLNTLLNILILSTIILILVFIRIKFFLGFGKYFISIFLFLFIMVVFSLTCVLSSNMLISLMFLVFLSFYSMFLIIYGYGIGIKVVIVVLFKSFADLLVIILCSNILFLQINAINDSFILNGYILNLILLLIFLIYSLFGLFGFWLFWAMEASYFISCFMHSCGFIAVGFLFLSKLSLLGFLEGLSFFTSFINIVSMTGYLAFIFMFFTTKDCKKSFGFYSAGSICFLLFTSLNYPFIALSYFFISSIVKILIFESLSFLNKVKSVRWIVSFLFSFNILIYTLLFLFYPSNSMFLEFLQLVFFIKIVSLVLFVFKVFNLLEIEERLSSYFTYFIIFIYIIIVLSINKVFISFIFLNNLLGCIAGYSFLLFIFFNISFYNFYLLEMFRNYFLELFSKIVSFIRLDFCYYFSVLFFKTSFVFKFLLRRNIISERHILFYCILIPFLIIILI